MYISGICVKLGFLGRRRTAVGDRHLGNQDAFSRSFRHTGGGANMVPNTVPKTGTWLQIKNKTQTAVINIVNKRILINLTSRMLDNIHFQK